MHSCFLPNETPPGFQLAVAGGGVDQSGFRFSLPSCLPVFFLISTTSFPPSLPSTFQLLLLMSAYRVVCSLMGECFGQEQEHYWAGQKNLVKGCRQTLDCYCVSCELLSASLADALLFVNILLSGIFHGRLAQRLAVNKPCLQIIRRLLWKQTTTHSLRNNNPMFDGNL